MREINIYLTRKGFNKPCLHYDVETKAYFIVANTKNNNRKLGKLIKSTKKALIKYNDITKNEKIKFNVRDYRQVCQNL